MDGAELFLINAVYFLGRIEQINLAIGSFLLKAMLVMLCSLGSAPVPSPCMVLLATMPTSPKVLMTSSSGLIVGIGWIVDRGVTSVNITRDSVVSAIVDRILGDSLDLEHLHAGEGAAQDDLALGWTAPEEDNSHSQGGASSTAWSRSAATRVPGVTGQPPGPPVGICTHRQARVLTWWCWRGRRRRR
ncbi:unnamed protein product, partial [Prorocentrum cordatum]